MEAIPLVVVNELALYKEFVMYTVTWDFHAKKAQHTARSANLHVASKLIIPRIINTHMDYVEISALRV